MTVAGTAIGVSKAAAVRIGVDFDTYKARIAAGDKWCTDCKSWVPRVDFNTDRSRGDGLAAICVMCNSVRGKARYQPKERKSRRGVLLVPARDGDKRQARARVNHRVDIGLIPDPNDLPCMDCGHVFGTDHRRHEYDHARGYDAAHQLDVEPVCSTCHHAREAAR